MHMIAQRSYAPKVQMNDQKSYKDGLREAQHITRIYAKTFYFASFFLKKRKKDAAYILYAVCRLSDEAIDAADGNTLRLQAISEKIESAYKGSGLYEPLTAALHSVVHAYKIPKIYFDQLLDGIRLDLINKEYEDFDDLRGYCYKVAGVVGLIMLQILGFNDPRAKIYAVDLGIAMQLTNILRDIGEDYRRGRIYLPQKELTRFKVTRENIADRAVDRNFIELMKFQIERARGFYREAERGVSYLTDRDSRLVVTVMQAMYAGILARIEEKGYDVFSERMGTTMLKKICIAARSSIKQFG